MQSSSDVRPIAPQPAPAGEDGGPALSARAGRPSRRLRARFVLAVLLAAVVVLPFVLSGYWVRLMTDVFLFAILAEAVNLISGYAGYAALGNVVFWGTGAYATGVLMVDLHQPFLVGLAASGLLSAAYAALVGVPILRLRGHYFVMGTIGLDLLTRELVYNIGFTGGGKGLNMPLPPWTPPALYAVFYFGMLAVLLACLACTWLVERSRLGFGLRAIRADEETAAVVGIPTTLYKVGAWVISAFFTGLAGGMYAYWQTYIDPGVVFDVVTSVQFFVMMMLGGMGTLWGPVIGAFAIEVLGTLIWGQFPVVHYMVLGLLIIVIVLGLPRGLVAWVAERWPSRAAA